MKLLSTFALLSALAAPLTYAQNFEIGAGVGGSFYRNRTLTTATQSASAGFSNGIAATAWVGQNTRGKWGGEFRYTYEKTDLKLSGAGQDVKRSGDTHAVHYDVLFHLKDRESRVRPFLSAGGGFKYYRGTFAETPTQPLSSVALLTKTGELKPMGSFGVGVKFQLTERTQIRAEVKDYLSPFPSKVITPNGSKGSGLLNDIVPMIGIAYTPGN